MAFATDPAGYGHEIPAAFWTSEDECFDCTNGNMGRLEDLQQIRQRLSHQIDGSAPTRIGISIMPRGIIIDENSDEQSTTSNIRGLLFEEGSRSQIKTRTLQNNINHPRKYSFIFRTGTTARGIEIDT